MSDDKELLEFAAKAAKLPECGWMADTFTYVKGNRFTTWSPLTDDGDVLRLAVAAGINIDMGDQSAWKRIRSGSVLIEEFWGGDYPPCYRHAIVRAAAEIGKAMS